MDQEKGNLPDLTKIQKCAIEAAHEAGRALVKHFGTKLDISEKVNAGLVTNADLEAQEKAVAILKKGYPDFNFLTEESKPEITGSLGRWIIDPLDGTTNFVHGFPMFCVSIAAEWNRELQVGVIYHPILKNTYVATKGKGAWLNGNRIHVSKTRRIEDALLTTGFTYEKLHDHLKMEIHTFEQLSQRARAIRRPGSAALDLAYTAQGVFDGFWERQLSPWDVAAGALLVTEAGGTITGFRGEVFQIDGKEILATNGVIHPQFLDLMSKS